MTRRETLRSLAAGAGALLSGCALFSNPNSIRMRLTLHVDTPSGRKTGSSVFECVRRKSSPILRPIDVGGQAILGQAPVIDLGDRGLVFAVLQDPLSLRDWGQIVNQAIQGIGIDQRLPQDYATADWPEAFRELKRLGVSGRVAADNHPMFVWVPELSDLARSAEVQADMFASIGAGIRFAGMTFQTVADSTPVDADFPERFPQIANRTSAFGKVPMGIPRDQQLALKLRASNFFVRPE